MEIDLKDPAVQRLLGTDGLAQATAKKKRELVQLAGDAPDPMGTDARGSATTYRLNRTAFANPRIWYRDKIITADAYRAEGEPMMVHIICPRCQNYLRIPADRKRLEIDLAQPPPAELLAQLPPHERLEAQKSGRIDIEPFECTWELKDAGKHVPGLVGSGVTLCRWKVGVEHNVARDA